MCRCFLGIALLVASTAYSQVNPVATKCSSAMDADGYIYLAGQSSSRPDGTVAEKFPEQVAQAFENVKAVVEAAGLNMEHIIYIQVYLDNQDNYPLFEAAFKKYFPGVPPAGAVLGVARLLSPGVQMNAIAVHDLNGRKAVTPPNYKWDEPFSPGILTHDRLFVSATQGMDPQTGKLADDPAAETDLALDGLNAIADAAGLTMKHFVFVNPYLTNKVPGKVMNERYARRFEFGNTPARATIQVTSLPRQANIEYTGIAVRDLNLRRAVRPRNMAPSSTASPCVFAGDTLYCSAKSGFIPGPHGGVFGSTTAAQLRQTMRNQLDNLEEADMDFSQVVSTTIYLDNLSDSGEFNRVFSEYFQGALPPQTSIQQLAPADRSPNPDQRYPDLEQMSLIAAKTPKTAIDKLCK